MFPGGHAVLSTQIFRFTVWSGRPPPGAALMNLRYRNERAPLSASKASTFQDLPAPVLAGTFDVYTLLSEDRHHRAFPLLGCGAILSPFIDERPCQAEASGDPCRRQCGDAQDWKDQAWISGRRCCMAWAQCSCGTCGQGQTRQCLAGVGLPSHPGKNCSEWPGWPSGEVF